MELAAALSSFLDNLAGNSPHTSRSYRLVLSRFVAWAQSRGIDDPGELTVTHLREWTAHLRALPSERQPARRLESGTVHHYALVTKIFVRWMEREEYIGIPITVRWKLPKAPEKELPALSASEVQQLLAIADYEQPKFRKYATEAIVSRNRAVITVLADTGLRRAELAGLRLCDVDYENVLLYVAARKGGNSQQVAISTEAMEVLDEYLAQHRPTLVKGERAHREDAVFVNGKGTALGTGGISQLFRELRKEAAIDGKQVSPHAMRRYMATTQLALGRDALHVQRQLGHSTLHMTNRYVRLTTEQLRASHEHFSPLRATLAARPSRPHKQYWQDT